MKNKAFLSPILASLIAFVVAAGLGLALRWAFVVNMPEWFNYRNIQHAHSHVALLGWLFAIFYLFLIHFLDLDFKRYSRLYWLLQFSVAGMLVTFPVIGYAQVSIFFSTAHILLAYIFVYRLWRDLRAKTQQRLPILFVKASLFFMVLSTLGTWALGPIMALKLKGTAIYYGAIQFYLHFQFNGWFVFALIGIVLVLMAKRGITFDQKKLHQFFVLLIISTMLTFALAVTWSTPYLSIFIVNSIGVILQLAALLLFLQIIYTKREEIKGFFNRYIYNLLFLSLLALALKIIVQAIVVIPYMAEISYTIRNFVIGFIHLLMLGCLSLFAFAIISVLMDKKLSNFGTWVFSIGVVLSELILFVQGLMLWQGMGFMPSYYMILSATSSLIFVGVLIISIQLYRTKIQAR